MGRKGDGVEARGRSIRIQFVLDGRRMRERLMLNGQPLPPTPANLKYAARLADDIRRRIGLGNFEFAEFFPDSKRVQSTPRATFGALADLWVSSVGQLAIATRSQYSGAVRLWKRILGEETPVRDIAHPVLAAKIGGYPWASAKSANNYLIVLRGVFALEYTGRRALDNPMTGIENLTAVRKLPDPLTAHERDAILTDIQGRYDEQIYAYFLFAFYSGTRPEEIIALRWADIDWRKKVARVQRVRTFRGSERDGSKTHTERDVDLVSSALAALSIMKPHTFLKAGDVFQNPVTGRPWHDERAQRDHYWTPALKRLGIRQRRAYATRHTYATVALMGGVNPAYIARQLGHASTKMLFDKYARWIDGADQGVEKQRLEAAMGLVSPHQRPKISERDCN